MQEVYNIINLDYNSISIFCYEINLLPKCKMLFQQLLETNYQEQMRNFNQIKYVYIMVLQVKKMHFKINNKFNS